MNDTATAIATQPLELIKANKSPNFYLKTIEDCMPIPLSWVKLAGLKTDGSTEAAALEAIHAGNRKKRKRS